MAKPLSLATDGSFQEIQPVTTSTGVADAGKLMQLDSAGRLDLSLMPTGIGADTVSAITSESLTAGDFVNFFNNAGTLTVRKAIAADNTKPAHGFVLSSYGISVPALVYVRGLNSLVLLAGFNAANIGKPAFLSTTSSGSAVPTRPVGAGQIVQVLGDIENVGATVTINFSKQNFTVLA